MNKRFDLHMHSTFSDGTMSPQELLYLAKEKKIDGISITDHDTILAYNDELFELAKKLDLLLIPGVEISSEYQDNNVHILAYNFDIKSEELNIFLKDLIKKRDERNYEILKKLKTKNIHISFDELNDFAKEKNILRASIGRVHIALLMQKKKYVKTMQEAFDLYIKDNASCYVKGFKYTPEFVVDIIHKSNGKASLAHPFFLKKRKLILEILSKGFDAIEVYYARLFLTEEKKYLDIAKNQNLLITGGSDFHGSIKPYLSLGSSWINDIELDKLLS